MKRTHALASALVVWAGFAHADAFTDSIVTNLQDLGYQHIEIKNGLTQTKVEAIRGTDKLEVVYDRSTGQILKRETERADAEEVGQSGVEIEMRNRDFLDDDDDRRSGRDDDDDDDRRSGRDDDDDDDDRSSGRDDDDDDDDSGRGSSDRDYDDDDDDDDNSGSGSRDDD